jgi:hypothetical protein
MAAAEQNQKPTKNYGGLVGGIAYGAFMVLIFLNTWLTDQGIGPTTKLWIFVGLALTLLVSILGALAVVYRRLPQVAGVTNFVLLLLVVCAFSVGPVVFLGESERIVVLKIGAIIFLSLLPGWLYLQFVAVKGKTLWDEYVFNLHRLHVDDYSNLPAPPPGSHFYRLWKAEYARAVAENPDILSSENLYTAKFRGLYGQTLKQGSDTLRFQGENLFPVIAATLVLAISWAMAFDPEIIRTDTWIPQSTRIKDLGLPHYPLLFGFVGTYFYILQMLVRRYYQDDLKTSAYINATVRIIVVGILVLTLHNVWPDDWKGDRAVAFLIGIFPQLGLQALRALIALPLQPFVPSLKTEYPLSDLDGMNIWYESRLLEEGIEDLQNLATANIVDVMLRTRIPVDRLVDWIDQAHLFLRVRKDDGSEKTHEPSSREKLRQLGIRTATDLENLGDEQHGLTEKHKWVLNGEQKDPSVTETIMKTLRDEPNLSHVRRWKLFSQELERRGKSVAHEGRTAAPGDDAAKPEK